MGAQTFGKGSVQTVRQLSPDTALKITTARYYTPSGASIQAKGIVPDVMLDETAEGNVFAALRVREADLEKHIGSGKGAEQKDEAREKAREEARKKLEEDAAKKAASAAQAAARVRQRRRLPAGAGAQPPEGQAGAGQQDHGRAQGRGRRPTERQPAPCRQRPHLRALLFACSAHEPARRHEPSVRSRAAARAAPELSDDTTAALLAPHPAQRAGHGGSAAPARRASAGDRRRWAGFAGGAVPGHGRCRHDHPGRRRHRRPDQSAAPDRAPPRSRRPAQGGLRRAQHRGDQSGGARDQAARAR